MLWIYVIAVFKVNQIWNYESKLHLFFGLASCLAEIQTLYSVTNLNLRDKILGDIKNNSFLLCQESTIRSLICVSLLRLLAIIRTSGQWRANALNTVYSDLEGVVRPFIVMVQLVNILLTGWHWSKWESASSILWSQPVWCLHCWRYHIVNCPV